MDSLLIKLQADIAARKRPRPEWFPRLRTGAVVLALGLLVYHTGARSAESSTPSWNEDVRRAAPAAVIAQLDAQQGELAIQRAQLEHLRRIHRLSSKYGIGADLAEAIHAIALSENVDPALAFELVRLESRFNPRAVSPVGALGYTQLMPATARLLQPGITRAQIFDRDTNLRLGFRFFRSMLERYNGDVRLALLAYNRGPTRVDSLLAKGVDPANGYAKTIMGRMED